MSDEPELDDDDVPPTGSTQILWGRVVVLLSALALAFWLGTTFGGDDGSRQEVRDQADEIARLQAQIAGLEAEIEARDTSASAASEQPTDEPSAVATAEASQQRRRERSESPDDQTAAEGEQVADAGGGGGDEQKQKVKEKEQRKQQDRDEQSEPSGRRYVIQSGDSLAAIAQEVYGDPTEWRAIARANDLQEPYSLTVGRALRIPPSP